MRLFQLIYETTYRCNSRCKYCDTWKWVSKEKEIGVNELNYFFSWVNNVEVADLTGGEPTLRKDLPKITEILCKNCEKVVLATNGSNPEMLEKLKFDNLWVGVAIDGRKEIHEKIKPISFDSAIRSLEVCKKAGIKRLINFCMIPENIRELPFVLSIAEKYEAILSIKFAHPFYRYKYRDDDLSFIEGLVKGFENKFNDLDKRIDFVNRNCVKHLKRDLCFKYCTAFNSMLLLNPYGELYPCFDLRPPCVWDDVRQEMGSKKYKIGDYKGLNRKKFMKLAKEFKNCSKCFTWDQIKKI